MSIELKSGFLGIVTETADLQAPPGALTRAKNVVIRRAGACEVRPGLYDFSRDTLTNAQRTLKIIGYEDSKILVGENSEWTLVVSAGVPILYPPPDGSSSISPSTFRDDLIPHAQTRGNLYVGTGNGILKFDGIDDATTGDAMFITAGAPSMFSTSYVLAAGTGAWLATNMHVRYRVVGVKTDSNGLVTRSRPSSAVTVSNTSGADRYVTLSVTPLVGNPERDRLWDSIEIYRTRQFPTTVEPDEEFQLATSKPISALISVDDMVPDASRGATLYTSPSREGAEGANDLPPACGALAVFKGALFAGNTIGPARRVYSYTPGGTVTGSATGIGTRLYVGTYTIGSNQITALASTVGLQKGMIAFDNAGPDPFSGGHIINISGATVTMSTNASAGSVGATMSFRDTISYDGGTTWLTSTPLNYISYSVLPALAGYSATRVIETAMPGASSALSMKATHGNEYFEPFPLYDDSPDTGDKDAYINGLRWSKPDEPEHFPPSNFAFVGDNKRAILALVSTRDAMFIFKEDGIWRLTGTNGQYRIDPFDLTTRCVLPSSVVPLKNRIFMLSNRGVVAVSDEGVEVVSGPIASQLAGAVSDLDISGIGSGYFLPGIGYAGAAIEATNEYLLLLGDALSGEASGIENGALVYNDKTRAWTSWEFDGGESGLSATPTTWAPVDRGTYVMVADYYQITLLRLLWPVNTPETTTGELQANDGMLPITVLTSVDGVVTYTPSTLARVGDAILAGTVVGRVTEINSSTEVVVDTGSAGGAIEPGAGFVVRPITCTVRPRAFIAPNQVMKEWVQYTSEFSQLNGAISMTVGALSSVVASTTDMVEQSGAMYVGPNGWSPYRMGASIRALLPVHAARGYRMHAETTWAQVLGSTTLEAIFVETRDGKTGAPNLAVSP